MNGARLVVRDSFSFGVKQWVDSLLLGHFFFLFFILLHSEA